MKKMIPIGLVLGACLWCMGCVPAHEEDQQFSTEYLSPPGDGWVNIAPGVWEREDSEHGVETYAVGVAGLRWMMPQLELAGATLQEVYESDPTQEHLEQLMGHEQMMAEVAQTLAQPEQAPAKNDQTAKCDVYFSGNANAYPLSPGAKATANATYQTTCSGFSGGVYTYTYAEVDSVWQANGCGWRYGASKSCSSASSMSGYGSCYSSAIAQVKDQVGVTYIWSKQNYSCGSYGGGGGGGGGTCGPLYCTEEP